MIGAAWPGLCGENLRHAGAVNSTSATIDYKTFSLLKAPTKDTMLNGSLNMDM